MDTKKALVAGSVIMAFLAAFLPGQSMSARILGHVTNEEDVPLVGVKVTAVNVTNNATLTKSIDDKDGAFRLLGLAPGIYQVSFELQGYEPYTAAGISLSVEQSVTLRIKLRKAAGDSASVSAVLAAQDQEEAQGKMRFFDERGRFSFHFTLGMNRIAVGDSNKYLSTFSQRVIGVRESFETLHSGIDLNAEIGYRITPRLELAVGLGWVQGYTWNNHLKSHSEWSPDSPYKTYFIDLNIKTIPLTLVCRYWLAASGNCLFSVHSALQYHFATWKMSTQYGQSSSPCLVETPERIFETASRQGLGLAAGGRAEFRIDTHCSWVIELNGRFAPLRNFSGRKEFYPNVYSSPAQVTDGKLWFYEFYDNDLKRWVRGLGIGDRPTGSETRNVSSAKVDFSGLALRTGLLLHF